MAGVGPMVADGRRRASPMVGTLGTRTCLRSTPP